MKIVLDKARLFVYYNTMGDSDRWETCIMGKQYPSIHMAGYVGVSAGNPSYSDINEVDVESIDFYNLNEQFYQFESEITKDQEYYARDESGFVGSTKYPSSAKLSTIAMGKVAYDVLEMKRLQREHIKE